MVINERVSAVFVLTRSSFSNDILDSKFKVWSAVRILKRECGIDMSKLLRILAVILVAFTLSSLLVYRLRLGGLQRNFRTTQSSRGIIEETRTVEGQIQSIDSASKTLTLMNNGEEVMLAFDERTAIMASGHPVQPATITSGTPAKVKYTQRGSKKWARRIELSRAEPTDSVESY